MSLWDQSIDDNNGDVGRVRRSQWLSDNDGGVGWGQRIRHASKGPETTTEATGDRQRAWGIYDGNGGVRGGRWERILQKNKTDASAEDIRCVQGIEDNDGAGSGSTTGLMGWQRQWSDDFTCFQVANSDTVSSISSYFIVLILISSDFFFLFATWNTISTAIMRKILSYQVHTNLVYIPPTYRGVKKLWALMINKELRKSLARKKGNENPIWRWNDLHVKWKSAFLIKQKNQ